VGHPPCEAHFAPESIEGVRVRGHVSSKGLEGDAPAELLVLGLIDLSDAAATEETDDAEAFGDERPILPRSAQATSPSLPRGRSGAGRILHRHVPRRGPAAAWFDEVTQTSRRGKNSCCPCPHPPILGLPADGTKASRLCRCRPDVASATTESKHARVRAVARSSSLPASQLGVVLHWADEVERLARPS
jgi:hypothetical protein